MDKGANYRWIISENIKHYEAQLEKNEKLRQILQKLLEDERERLRKLDDEHSG